MPTNPTSTTEDALMRLDDDGGSAASRVPEVQCGRCRLFFEGDATLIHRGVPEWWLCPTCRAALLPDPPARRSSPGHAAPAGMHDVS
jgi:hypothetical protein